YISTTLNKGHFLGRGKETIIFPTLPRDEEPQVTTQESMFNYVRRSSGGSPRHAGVLSEVDIIVSLASGAVDGVDWEQYRDYQAIRNLLAECLDGFNPDEEHQIKGRTFHKPLFNTPNQKAKAHAVSLPTPKHILDNQLRLMTIRSEGQFNTVVYEEEDVFRNQTRRDIIMMSQDDIARLGLSENELVIVDGPSGSMQVIARQIDITPGNCAMYYPEANVLLSTTIDQESRTPAFKGEVVNVRRSV
ncbi:MAG: hypothetical protein MK073_01310, partial [Phycisphaerales bacterium]|nr:hypothetical protein [Phycisphaerales bacterium]